MNDLSSLLSGYWVGAEMAASVVVFLNILGALALGLLVGYERSYRGRAAGMRTYGLVCMASCALTVISGYPEYWYGGHSNINAIDPGRIIQGIVTGIGFLGAGVIMRDGLNISGLTTAASIWSVAAIGVLVGVGFYAAAIPLALISAAFMMWGAKLENVLPSHHAVAVHLSFRRDHVPDDGVIKKIIQDLGYVLASGSFAVSERDHQMEWRFVAVSLGKDKSASILSLSQALSVADGVAGLNVSHARN